jgi:hypothetical protein
VQRACRYDEGPAGFKDECEAKGLSDTASWRGTVVRLLALECRKSKP